MRVIALSLCVYPTYSVYIMTWLLGVKGMATVSNHIIEVERYLGIEAVR